MRRSGTHPGDLDGRFPDAPLDGAALHARVPPSRWCVTSSDLRHFRSVVRRGVREGDIERTDEDPFDPDDACIGPSIATVTRQLIAPVTARFGNPSWALMLHPEGLPCDLFVTHCWMEGVYEFVDKVLHSWPNGAWCAYCCMLSNPQNLDISGLVNRPDCSPFAQALRNARCTLVVPNNKCSVYTRIWCVYEAYLSYSHDKVILTAARPDRAHWIHACAALLTLASAFLVGFLALRHQCMEMHAWVHMIMSGAVGTCTATGLLMRPSVATMIVDHVGAALSGFFAAFVYSAVTCESFDFFFSCVEETDRSVPVLFRSSFGSFIAMGIYFCVREADRVRASRRARETAQLRSGYTGRLQDAQSSVASDREKILGEIQEQGLAAEVEQAIKVLMSAGMSTPSLRAADKRGIDVSTAVQWSYANAYVNWLTFLLSMASTIATGTSCNSGMAWILWTFVAEGVFWFVLFANSGYDHRGLITSAWLIFGAIPYMLGLCCAMLAASLLSWDICEVQCALDVGMTFTCGPAILAVAWLGVDGTLRLPRVGPALVRFLLRPDCVQDGWRGLCPTDLAWRKAPACASSSDVDSEDNASNHESDDSAD